MSRPDLDLSTLPPELQAALERVWPGCPEAQRRAVLGPWAEYGFVTVWPSFLWPWQPRRRWWQPGAARDWRGMLEFQFGSQQRNLLTATGPCLFGPEQPFFETPWTQAKLLLRSPQPEVFTDAEFWAITTQLCDGDVVVAERETRAYARDAIKHGAVKRGYRRDSWWRARMVIEHASATGSLGGL